ncbi:MAG: chemotaxis protein CheW [Phycisphaerae bacterium]
MAEKDIISKGSRMLPHQKKATPEKEAEALQLIVFNLGDEEYGANINQVREIIRTRTITPIPDSPDFIKGVSNVRGEIPVIIDLKARFFLPQDEDVESKNIVITEQEKNIFGLLVDEVTEVLRIPETDIKPTPELVTRIDRTYISGMITIENRLIILLDLTKVLSEEELAKLAELAQKHRAAKEKQEIKKEEKRTAEVSVEVSANAEDEDADRKATEPQPVQVEDK